jgi:hypothetical protein
VQRFFHLKFYIPTEMPRRHVTLADRIAFLERIKNQLPDTSQLQLAGITGVPMPTISRVIQQQDKLRDERTLRHGQEGISQKWKCEGKDPHVGEVLSQWFSTVTGVCVRVSVPMLKSSS